MEFVVLVSVGILPNVEGHVEPFVPATTSALLQTPGRTELAESTLKTLKMLLLTYHFCILYIYIYIDIILIIEY